MAIKTREWVQREWTLADVGLFRDKGDFDLLSSLVRSPNGHKLRRAPGWATAVSFTDEPVKGGAFYDESNVRRVFIVTNASDLLTEYASDAWSVSAGGTILAGKTALGGLDGRNCVYWGGKLYIIDSAGDVYAGSDYTAALTQLYDGSNAVVLAPFGDYMYCATSAGDVIRLHQSTFEIIFTASSTLAIEYMTAYRGHLVIIARSLDGTMAMHTFNPGSPGLSTVAQVLAPPSNLPTNGCFYTQHDGLIYLSPGRFKKPDASYDLDIYSFNGSRIELVTRLSGTASGLVAAGLLSWREHLIYYGLVEADAASAQIFNVLLDGHFNVFAPLTTGAWSGFDPFAYALGGELILTACTTVPVHSFHHLGDDSLADGYVQSAYLDMGHPNKTKRLERITALLDGKATDFKILLKYRTDDTSGWTTAATGNNTARASVEDIGAEFYRVQLRVDLDDDSGGDEDIAIESISCLYVVDE